MSVIKINALTVPAESGDEIVSRFEPAIGHLPELAGFESFQLLKPTDGKDVWFVLTQWSSEEAYEAWRNSSAFARSHASAGERPAPVATSSELLEFVPVLSASGRTSG
jgi:heme oxygenase (mycobilin-producing)